MMVDRTALIGSSPSSGDPDAGVSAEWLAQVARIIEPEAWRKADARAATADRDSRWPSRADRVAKNRRAVEVYTAPSLAKARAAIAVRPYLELGADCPTCGNYIGIELSAELCGMVRETAKRLLGGNCTFADDDLAMIEHLAERACQAGLIDTLHPSIQSKVFWRLFSDPKPPSPAWPLEGQDETAPLLGSEATGGMIP